MLHAHIAPFKGPIRNIIVHANEEGYQALTIDCATGGDLTTVYNGELSTLDEGELIQNHDDSVDHNFHNMLHSDMQSAMRVDLAGSLTDFHQHWVNKNQKSLSPQYLKKILKYFQTRGWITHEDANSLFKGNKT